MRCLVALSVLVAAFVGIGCSSQPVSPSAGRGAPVGQLTQQPTVSTSAATTPSSAVSTVTNVPAAAVASDEARTEIIQFVADRSVRTGRLRLPTHLVSAKAPLVLALHGSEGSAADMEQFSGLNDVADRVGFFVAYADGLQIDIGAGFISQSWNSGECCEPATSADVDDVGFLTELIDRLITSYPVDPTRVFVVGHSNGAIMAQLLGCRIAGRLAAVASIAGALDDTSQCRPSRPIPFLEVHGTADQSVFFDAGERAVQAWREFDRCSGVETRHEAGDVTTIEWSECASGSKVRFLAIDGADHPWPSRTTPSLDGVPVSFAVSAAEESWAFFSSVSPG